MRPTNKRERGPRALCPESRELKLKLSDDTDFALRFEVRSQVETYHPLTLREDEQKKSSNEAKEYDPTSRNRN